VLPDAKPPVIGVSTEARLVSGDVFVKLPAGAAGSSSLLQDPGFVALKGAATLPLGTVIDARLGTLTLTAAADGRRANGSPKLPRQATFSGGMFRIRQARAVRGRPTKRVPPSAVLVTPPGAAAVCAKQRGAVSVRTLLVTARALAGTFRVAGGASTTVPSRATPAFRVTDRCDGTLTQVANGAVTVTPAAKGRTRTVKARHVTLVKKRQFASGR
jgi:hypothetical protein